MSLEMETGHNGDIIDSTEYGEDGNGR